MNSANYRFSDVSLGESEVIKSFLYAESRMLSEHRLKDWLSLLHEDIHYWMPCIENRRRQDQLECGSYASNHMAFFDDGLLDLQRRVSRFYQPKAWAENPATRNVHIVSNIEVFYGDEPDTFVVFSSIQNFRNRGISESEAVISARREDRIVKNDEEYQLIKRLIIVPNSTLNCKNINTFL